MTFYGYGEDTFSISSWNLEETEGKAALRRELNERFRNEHPDRSHLISQASQYEYTDVFGEGIEGSEEGGQVAEAEDAIVGGQPATAFCICPIECVGLACNDCAKLAPTIAQKRSATNERGSE